MSVFRVPIDLAWDGPGTPGVNVWHIRTVLDAGGTDLQQAVDAVRTFYHSCNGAGTLANSVFPSGYTANVGQAVNVVDQTTAQPTFTQVTGGASTTEAPQLLQMCVSWRTSIAARRGMGRTFVGPLTGAQVQSDGTIFGTGVTRVRDAAIALVTASTAATGWAVGVYGLQNPAPEGTTDFGALPHVLRDITGSSVRDRFAVLRSRRD